MSSSNSPVLIFEPRWSVQRCALVIVQGVICIVVPWLIPYWPVYARLLLSSGALVLLAIGYQRAGWWGPHRIVRVVWQQSGEWLLQQMSGVKPPTLPWVLSGDSYVSSWLLVLRWRNAGSSARLVIFPGEIAAAAWRQWQARLRLEGQ